VRELAAGLCDRLGYHRPMEAPEVTVILPVRNRARHLRSAIDSVFAQTFAGWELVIADDGSDDPETLALLAGLTDPRVRVLHLEGTGSPAAARNAAMAEARGQILAFLDSDDLWPPGKLAVQLAALRARPDCGWSYGYCDCIDADGAPMATRGGRKWLPHDRDMVRRLLRIEAQIGAPTVMMRRELAQALGGFDVEQKFAEDYDMWIRAAAASDVVVVGDVVALVRNHGDNYSSDRLAAHRGWLRLYDKFARAAPDKAARALARRLRAASGLRVAALVADRPGGRAEARLLFRRHLPLLLLQPATWPQAARLLPRLLRG
jgi:glycosyltransferase involved in cell wall biosynthesis